ncbi:MAG: hypothetical protein MMC33_003004 [Icmadophila ericetorum]|nr:hypothetical protein [Icmadophila ericetorum]
MGGIWLTLAFIFRVASIFNQTSLGLFSAQFILILISPLWINAYCYMVLGRMIHYFTPGQTVLKLNARRLALIFVLLDITAFLVQVGGALLTVSTDVSTEKTGLNIYTAGVSIQLVFILFFLGLASRFHSKVRKEHEFALRETSWKLLLYVLYTVLSLISIRIIYRVIEFSGGPTSTIPKTESYAYIFDSTLMFIALVLFNVIHPGRILVGPESEFPKKVKLSRAEKKRAKQEKKDLKARVKEGKRLGSTGSSPSPPTYQMELEAV